MVPPQLAPRRPIRPRRRKHPLPRPPPPRGGIPPGQRVRQHHRKARVRKVRLPQAPHLLQVRLQRPPHHHREHGHPIAIPLPPPPQNRVAPRVHVLHPQPPTPQQPPPRA